MDYVTIMNDGNIIEEINKVIEGHDAKEEATSETRV